MADEPINTLTLKDARRLSRMLKWFEGGGSIGTPRNRVLDTPDYRFGSWKNTSSETCPAYGIFAATSQATVSGMVTVQGAKPSTTFYRTYYANWGAPVIAGDYGKYQKLSEVIALYDSGTPANGEGYGPKPGEWKLFANYPSTADVIGIEDSTNKYLKCNWHLINEAIGKLDGTLAQGSSQTVSLWGGTAGSEVDTTVSVLLCRDWLMKSGATAIASGKKVHVKWINGIPYVMNAECA